MNDDSARTELENAKREAIKALGVVAKVKEKVEVIELILTAEILLFINLESHDLRHFYSTRDQCLYFLRKLKELPQVSHFIDVELKGAFSKGTFHSDRMWLLSEVFRMVVDVASFFSAFIKQQYESGVELLPGADGHLCVAFQNSMEALYSKTKDGALNQLLTRQMNDALDRYSLTLDVDRWKAAKSVATLLSLDIREAFKDTFHSLVARNMKQFETSKDLTILSKIYALQATTGIPFSSEASANWHSLLEENARAFFNDGNREYLRVLDAVSSLFDVKLSSTSEVVPQLLSYWWNLFRRYDNEGDSSSMYCVPTLISIYGSLDYILDGREEVGCVDGHADKYVEASSFSSPYEPGNVFSSEKNAKWMSGDLSCRRPFHEWISRRFGNPVKIVLVAVKATPHAEAAPTKLSLEGKSEDGDGDDAGAWRTLIRAESVIWKSSRWKTFAVSAPQHFTQYRINFFDNASSNVVSVFKIKYFV